MLKRRFLFKVLFLIIVSLVITYLLVIYIGKPVENFETGIYQKLIGKRPQHFQSDSNGVTLVVYEGLLGRQYNTVTIAEQAVNLSKIKDTSSVKDFFNCIKWLRENNSILNDSSIIFYDYYDWPAYRMTSPWRSAMNQGRAMQAFLKAFQKTGDTLYLNLSRRSMNALFTEVKDGGVTYKDSSGYWYEEYADDNVPQSRVLNGMIVVLQALSDFYKTTNDPDALFLFTKGVSSVKNNLHFYDNNGHSNYDILGKPAKPWYHKFHIELLDFLYNETHDHIFNDYKQKWMRYEEPSYLVSLIHKPTRIGVFAVFSIFVGVLLIGSILSYFIWFRKSKVEMV
jgi:heparosan-N-sulfate-glucuronate 5-epimerase